MNTIKTMSFKPQRFEIGQEITPKHGVFAYKGYNPPRFGEIVRVREYLYPIHPTEGWMISVFERPDNYFFPEVCFDPITSIGEIMKLLKEEPEHV